MWGFAGRQEDCPRLLAHESMSGTPHRSLAAVSGPSSALDSGNGGWRMGWGGPGGPAYVSPTTLSAAQFPCRFQNRPLLRRASLTEQVRIAQGTAVGSLCGGAEVAPRRETSLDATHDGRTHCTHGATKMGTGAPVAHGGKHRARQGPYEERARGRQGVHCSL